MKFNIRAVEEDDLEFIRNIRNDVELYPFLGTFEIISKAKQIKWFKSLQDDDARLYLIFETYNKKKIGYVRITQIDKLNKSMCVGGDISKDNRGKGYSKYMYELIFDLGFNKLNMNRLWLFVLETNERAIHIYEKLGFKQEGRQRKAIFKDGKYCDYIMMSILREEYKINTKGEL